MIRATALLGFSQMIMFTEFELAYEMKLDRVVSEGRDNIIPGYCETVRDALL